MTRQRYFLEFQPTKLNQYRNHRTRPRLFRLALLQIRRCCFCTLMENERMTRLNFLMAKTEKAPKTVRNNINNETHLLYQRMTVFRCFLNENVRFSFLLDILKLNYASVIQHVQLVSY